MTADARVGAHPILPSAGSEPTVPFYWNGERLMARPGEMIASALIAGGHLRFGTHPRDGQPLGLFCANGQCAQCTVVANGVAVKSCLVPVAPEMVIEACDRRPGLPALVEAPVISPTEILRPDVLIVGAGPAGATAALELGRAGVDTLIVDDQGHVGGKLVLQTHKFFGSVERTSAGTRGIDIATRLGAELAAAANVRLWLRSTAVGVFSDGRVGVVRATEDGERYHLIEPRVLLVATGAREKTLVFPGHTLPGVLGAGAFQTLVNRDRVRPCERLLVVGGGNVGLIAAYHALQAGIGVVALVEALPAIGGYAVHADKIRRLGVPVLTSHTIIAAHGSERVEAVTIAEVDAEFGVVPDTQTSHAVDAVLIGVGLTPIDELAAAAAEAGMAVHRAGDAAEVAEASAATVSGRIEARRIAIALGRDLPPVPAGWEAELETLKARPGPRGPVGEAPAGHVIYPVFRCTQDIPCNPCVHSCPKHAIALEGDDLRSPPRWTGDGCVGCAKCVAACPGLAITVVDARDAARPLVTVAFEQPGTDVAPGAHVLATDADGVPLGRFRVAEVINRRFADRTRLVRIEATPETAGRIAGLRVQDPADLRPIDPPGEAPADDETIICRCEHVTAGAIRTAIGAGVRDVNELKSRLRVCMGACCGKHCPAHIARLFREAGVDPGDVTPATPRPLFVEVPFGVFAGGSGRSARADDA